MQPLPDPTALHKKELHAFGECWNEIKGHPTPPWNTLACVNLPEPFPDLSTLSLIVSHGGYPGRALSYSCDNEMQGLRRTSSASSPGPRREGQPVDTLIQSLAGRWGSPTSGWARKGHVVLVGRLRSHQNRQQAQASDAREQIEARESERAVAPNAGSQPVPPARSIASSSQRFVARRGCGEKHTPSQGREVDQDVRDGRPENAPRGVGDPGPLRTRASKAAPPAQLCPIGSLVLAQRPTWEPGGRRAKPRLE